jgi:hypothetical protein
MTENELHIAIKEAKRFIKKAKELKETKHTYPFWSPKENAAMKRASMDLTRALVKTRK